MFLAVYPRTGLYRKLVWMLTPEPCDEVRESKFLDHSRKDSHHPCQMGPSHKLFMPLVSRELGTHGMFWNTPHYVNK